MLDVILSGLDDLSFEALARLLDVTYRRLTSPPLFGHDHHRLEDRVCGRYSTGQEPE